MKTILASILIALFLPTAVYASDRVNSSTSDIESWYAYWAIGLADNQYPGSLQSSINSLESSYGTTRTQLAFDMFGFYWPVNNKTTLGFVISGAADRFESSNGYSLQVNRYLYGLSAMHFFGRTIGDGFYIRGDAGIAKINLDTNYGYYGTSNNGSGYLVGVGYAWPVSRQSRLLVGLNTSTITVEGYKYTATTLTIGGLW